MPAWIWVLAACAVAWVVFVAVFHPFRKGAHAAPRALPVRVDAGSMTLAEERTLLLSAPLLADQWAERFPPWQSLEPACRGCVQTDYGLVCRADLGGHCAEAAPLAPLGGQLGPRARAVLDRYNARCVERWGHAIAG